VGRGWSCRDIFIVDTRGGLAPHLAWGGTDVVTTFCGLTFATMSRAPFSLAGCTKCRRSARTQDVARTTDVDGEPVDL